MLGVKIGKKENNNRLEKNLNILQLNNFSALFFLGKPMRQLKRIFSNEERNFKTPYR